MKTKKLNIFLNKRLWVALIAATLVCLAITFSVLAEDNIDTSASSKNRIIFLGDRPEGINEVYEITNTASLVEADLALLRWNAMGNNADNSNDKIIGVFGEEDQTKEKYYGYWDVYEQVYARLLAQSDKPDKQSPTFTANTNITTGNIKIIRLSKDSRGYFHLGYTHTAKGGILIFLAEDAETIKATDNGSFVVNSGGILVIQGRAQSKQLTFTHLEKSSSGTNYGTTKDKDLITVSEGSLYMSNCVITDIDFTDKGKSAIIFPNGNTKENPDAGNTERHLYMSNCNMTNITADEAGGIFCKVYGENNNDLAELSSLYIHKTDFVNCTTKGGNTIGGSAIRSYAADRCDLFVTNCTFDKNKCTATGTASGGGAIYWKSARGTATLTGCTFTNNYSKKVGGAIFNTGSMVINSCTFTNNEAGDSGGAIAVEPPYTSSTIGGLNNYIDELSGSLILDQSTSLTNNTAGEYGGGIYFNAYASQITKDHQINIFQMNLTVNGAKIKNNSAKYGGGVAMWLDYKDRTYTTGISITSTNEIIGNHADVAGGAIWMNSANDCQCFRNGGVTMESGTVSQNYAPSGGAVYIGAGTAATNMEFKMQGGTVSGNGVNEQGATVTANGGAIYMTSGTCTISGGTIDNCKATGDGGGVYLGGGTFALYYNLSAATISNCSAGNNGGGVYLGAGTMTINGGIITNNTAQNGGGAYVNATNVNHGILVTGGEISENTATKGGGLAVNNGYFKMSGGNIHNNTAYNLGGAIYVSATTDVEVDIRSGIIENNYAAVSGGALGVEGLDDGVEFTITIGINQAHYDSNGNEKQCDHDFNVAGDVNPESDTGIYDCPVIKNNTALKTGGGIYITGSENAMLNVYCLVEEGNKAADGKLNDQGKPDTSKPTKSDFMMVNGGTVTLTTADTPGLADGEKDTGSKGNIVINGSIHVTAGKMTLDGSISNPRINGEITVDVKKAEDFKDYRYSDPEAEVKYYTIQYFENFLNEDTGSRSGQYTVFLVKEGEKHKILPALYSHEGYMIDGWWENEDNSGKEYSVNTEIELNESTGNLTLWAKWLRVGYWVYFDSGTDATTSGSMERQRFDYITAETPESAFINLNENTFSRVGYVFDGWSKTLGGPRDYTDQQQIRANITTERTVTLYACWILCTHKDDVNAVFTYSESDTGNAIIRTCSCKACTQTATLTATGGVYDGTTSYTAKVTVVADSANGKSAPTWELGPIQYSATKIGNNEQQVDNPSSCIGAGNYTASITCEGKKATITYQIDKATQTAPAKPTYKSNETNSDITKGKIVIIDPNDTTGKTLQYKIVWHDGSGTKNEITAGLSAAINPGFVLTDNYTNYYVYVQYIGDDNHYASEWVMADAVLFYDGNVYIHISAETGITVLSQADKNNRGLDILIKPVTSDDPNKDSYYLFDLQITQNNAGSHTLDFNINNISEGEWQKKIRVMNIPTTQAEDARIDLYVKITGVKLETKVTSTITASEEFGTVTGTEATITRDSAYTAYFEVKNYYSDVYTNPTLSFGGTTLPIDTTVILIDRSNGTTYYSYTASGSETQIPLTDFVQMGTAGTPFTPPVTSLDKPLKYQVVVDFSDCAEWDGTSITTSLTAMLVEGASVKGAPAFPDNSRSTTLTTYPQSPDFTIVSSGTVASVTNISYPIASAASSKWNNRTVSLVLTTTAILPVDARIDVTDGESNAIYYRNANGEFIIPLVDFNVNSLTLTLVSDLFPAAEQSYNFDVKLIYSDSMAGKAPSNGQKLKSVSGITFSVAASVEPAIKIDTTNLRTIWYPNETIPIVVASSNVPNNSKVILRLFYKEVEKGWTDTSSKVQVRESEDGTRYLPADVPLGNLTGSYYILLELQDSFGDIIMTDKYYFTVSDKTPIN